MRRGVLALLAVLLLSVSAFTEPRTDYRLAVVLVHFTDTPPPAWGPTQVARTLRDVTAEYLSYSYGRVRIVPDVYGWYTLDAAAGTACPKKAMQTLGETAVRKEFGGAVLSRYQAIMFVTTGVDCGHTEGTASIGGSPAYIWIFSGNNGRLISHELAHAFGRPHSGSRACSAAGCTEHEYGDPYDRVGCGARPQHFNAAQKEAQGWLGAPGFPSIRQVTASGAYWIDAYEPPGGEDSVRSLKVATGRKDSSGRDIFYYVESRGADGTGRVLLHVAGTGPDRPLSVHLVDLAPVSTRFDAVLDTGQTFTDFAAGVAFTTLSSSAAGSLVRVDVTDAVIPRAARSPDLRASRAEPAPTTRPLPPREGLPPPPSASPDRQD
jgi:hypothetical protein